MSECGNNATRKQQLSRRRLLQTAGAVGVGSLAVGSGRAAGGDLLWEQPFTREPRSFATDFPGVTIVEGTLLSYDSTGLLALNQANGSEQWQFETQYRTQTTAKAITGTAYINSISSDLRSGALHAVDLETGCEQWQRPLGTSGVRVSGETVYLTYADNEDGVVSINATDGSERWRTPLSLGAQLGAVGNGGLCANRTSFSSS